MRELVKNRQSDQREIEDSSHSVPRANGHPVLHCCSLRLSDITYAISKDIDGNYGNNADYWTAKAIKERGQELRAGTIGQNELRL